MRDEQVIKPVEERLSIMTVVAQLSKGSQCGDVREVVCILHYAGMRQVFSNDHYVTYFKDEVENEITQIHDTHHSSSHSM